MKNIFLIITFLSLFSILAQEKTGKFSTEIQKFVQTLELKHAHCGISVRELISGKEVVNFHANNSFAPASNLKLLYTLAAIDKLGKDFHYKTRLLYSGEITDGILNGDLVFQPSGDPSFASIRMKEDLEKQLASIVASIKKKGIKQVKGKLVMELNGWRYPLPGSIPIEDVGNYYGTGAWDFNFNDNRLDVYLQRSEQENQPTTILKIYPQVKGVKYINKVKTAAAGTGDESYVYAAPFDDERYILGTIPVGIKTFKVKAGMPNPPLSFLKILRDKLLASGVSIEGIQIKNTRGKYSQQIWQYTSRPLLDIVKTTNDYSMNHFSEALAWTLIQGDEPADGYLDKQKIHSFFTPYGFAEADIEDGSGLAPDNLVEPAQMTQFLSLMNKKLGKKLLLDILPYGAVDGYAKYFLRNNRWQTRVWVKSGSVSKVRNYTGVFRAKSGKYYAFSVMTNFFTGKHKDVRKSIEKLLVGFMQAL